MQNCIAFVLVNDVISLASLFVMSLSKKIPGSHFGICGVVSGYFDHDLIFSSRAKLKAKEWTRRVIDDR